MYAPRSAPPLPPHRVPFHDITNTARVQIYALHHTAKLPQTKIPAVLKAQQIHPPSPATISRIIQHNHTHISMNRGGNRLPTSLIDADKNLIISLQEAHNEWRLSDIRKELKNRTGKEISISTISRVLKKGEITTKMLSTEIITKNDEYHKKARIDYVRSYEGTDGLQPKRTFPLPSAHNTIFLDETPFHQGQHRKRGRSKKGKKAVKKQKLLQGRNVSIIAAVSPAIGLLHYEKSVGTQKQPGDATKQFTNFCSTAYNKLNEAMKRQVNYWIMDNVAFHNSFQLQKLFNSKDPQQKLKFLPTYSPPLNPIEYCFSVWKNDSKYINMTTIKQVYDAIDAGAEKITDRLVRKEYRHVVTKVFQQVKNMEDL